MKKVLVVAQNFYPEIGSAANRIKNIYSELTEAGYDVTILTTDPRYPNQNLYKNKEFWDEEFLDSEKIIRVKPKTRKYTNNMIRRLFLYLEITFRFIMAIFGMKEKYDYVFVSTPPIFIGAAGIFAKKRLSAKLILDVRDLWPESLLGVGVFANRFVLSIAYVLEKFLYRSADQIIVNSEGFIPYIELKGIKREVISFMPSSLTEKELEMVTQQSRVNVKDTDEITVIYTGNIGLAQDVRKLIDVAEYVKQNKYLKFKIIGYGFKSYEVAEVIKKRNLSNIEIVKAKSRSATLKEVENAHIAYVSLVDKKVFQTVLPGKIIDYMCMRKPIVGDVSGYAEKVITEAECGIISHDRTVEELGKHILTLAENEVLRKGMGNKAHSYAFQNLRWKNNIKVLTNLMEEQDVSAESLYVRMEPLHK
ncbi:glycosyltransferase family 4 protein [Bacillus gaemokensis]|uniref:Glycosyl transferase n=1 Tax=Bacillus gaemokensis TaxID=574375 RepID=A0A073KFX9_9BACI|nr:glycosyltransferase family 4 protein [Bacillus gaemokensis]KEK25455.1 glycosyl transferase [Bacillus gaemokensis]KYG37100.1 glycosyltransferase WbuB [Bacillus gaemokensis]